tara:strand:- start:275 stop:973 length:699 start_codon:yes stop_codon:yes gene_type:complete
MELISTINLDTKVSDSSSNRYKEKKIKICKDIKMSFEELITKVMKEVRPHAMSLTGKDIDKADELIAIMNEKLFNNKEKFMSVEKPKAYAERVITNSYIDIYRRENIRLIKEDKNISYSFDENGYPINDKGERVHKGHDFDQKNSIKKNISIEKNEIQVANEGYQENSIKFERMIKCLNNMNEEDQIILAMVGSGWSYKEIHESFKKYTMENIKQKILRARKKLAKDYGKKT